jgi:hypothetical protein
MKRLEAITNVALLVVAVLAGVVLVRDRVVRSQPATVSGPARGDKLSIPGLTWKKGTKTLVMALQTTCHFCSDSAPLYRQLAAASAGPELVVVTPQSIEEGNKYLKSLAIPIADVRQVNLPDIGVRATPTLVLVDDSGTVQQAWQGKLPPNAEPEVLALFGGGHQRR